MRYHTGDLAILSAESYDDGRRRHHLASGKTKTTVADVVTRGPQEGPPKKRRKTSSPDTIGEEEDKKRIRGRPRLEPKDETAQDRRRTQIRLAQRAYRNRKENAIQTLERRVQELKDTNEEMNNAFLRLHDYAVGCGLLDRMPDVGRQLRETTQKFRALARKSTDDALHDDDHNASRDSDSQPAKRSRRRRKSSSPEPLSTTERPPPPQRQLYGGLVVSQAHVSISTPTSSDIRSGTTGIVEPDRTPQYEVVTYPTLDNASLPFGLTTDFSFASQELSTSTTGQPGFSTSTAAQPDHTNALSQQPAFPDLGLTSPLYPSLPLPTSYAAQEVTFGRRFQRSALERGWALVTMPDPPQKRLARVFGFCLLFEPLEAIKTRLRRGLDRTTAESLNYWQYPFLQLGGSTTHLDSTTTATATTTTTTAATTATTATTASPSTTPATTSASRRRIGNQGTTDVMRSKQANGFSMGPFDTRTSAARDLLDEGQYMPPGWGGSGGGGGGPGFAAEFYDCDEVEMYLLQRGVVIPPAADFVTVEIEASAFDDGPGEGDGTSRRHEGGRSSGLGNAEAGSGSVNQLAMFARDTFSLSGCASGSGSGSGSDANSMSSGAMSSPGASSGGETSLTVPSSADLSHTDMWTFEGVDGNPRSGKKQVTVDVNLLIFEMVERATCLGRSPGVRKKDINHAFWNATKYSS